MTSKEFELIINDLSNPITKILDVDKINNLLYNEKHKIISYMIKHKMPIIVPFLRKEDMKWIHSHGYSYFAKNKNFFYSIKKEHQKLFNNTIILDLNKYQELKNLL